MNNCKAVTILIVLGIIVCITIPCIVGLKWKSSEKGNFSDLFAPIPSMLRPSLQIPMNPLGVFYPNASFSKIISNKSLNKRPTQNSLMAESGMDKNYQVTLKLSENGAGICKGALIHSQAILTTSDWFGLDFFKIFAIF